MMIRLVGSQTTAIARFLGFPSTGRLVRATIYIATTLFASLFAKDRASLAVERLAAPVFPSKSWIVATPAEVGLSETELRRSSRLRAPRRWIRICHAWRQIGNVLGRPPPAIRFEVVNQVHRRNGSRAWQSLTARSRLPTRPTASSRGLVLRPKRTSRPDGWTRSRCCTWPRKRPASKSRAGMASYLFQPGTKWYYSDGGPNWLAECVTLVYRGTWTRLMFERVFTPLGIRQDDLVWREQRLPPAGNRRHRAARVRLRRQRQRRRDGADRLTCISARAAGMASTILPAEFVNKQARAEPAVVGLAECRRGQLRQGVGPLRAAVVEQRRRHAGRRAPRRLLVVGALRQLDRRHSQPGHRRRAGRQFVEAAAADHYDVLKPFLEPIAWLARAKKGRE